MIFEGELYDKLKSLSIGSNIFSLVPYAVLSQSIHLVKKGLKDRNIKVDDLIASNKNNGMEEEMEPKEFIKAFSVLDLNNDWYHEPKKNVDPKIHDMHEVAVEVMPSLKSRMSVIGKASQTIYNVLTLYDHPDNNMTKTRLFSMLK